MQKSAKYKVVFNRKNKLNKDNKAPIEIVIYFNSKRKIISTKLLIEPRYWDDKTSHVKTTHPEGLKYNQLIYNSLDKYKEIELKCIIEKKEFKLNFIDDVEIIGSFTKFFLNEIKIRKNITETSRKSSIVAYKSFEKFAGNVKFTDVNYNLIADYDNWLRQNFDSGHTVNTRHKVLKTYINFAIKKGFMDANKYPYRNFKLKAATSNRLDLSFNKIKKLEYLELNNKSLDHSRDLFLFSCYTGLRYEDVKALNKTDVDRNNILKINVIKTKKELILPLPYLFNGRAIELISKYKNEDSERIFPQYSNAHVNRNLKVISHLINFRGVLSFHIARHTFGSRLAEIKPDPYLIMELMGHSDIKTSMIYIKSSRKVIEDKLKNIDW